MYSTEKIASRNAHKKTLKISDLSALKTPIIRLFVDAVLKKDSQEPVLRIARIRLRRFEPYR